MVVFNKFRGQQDILQEEPTLDESTLVWLYKTRKEDFETISQYLGDLFVNKVAERY